MSNTDILHQRFFINSDCAYYPTTTTTSTINTYSETANINLDLVPTLTNSEIARIDPDLVPALTNVNPDLVSAIMNNVKEFSMENTKDLTRYKISSEVPTKNGITLTVKPKFQVIPTIKKVIFNPPATVVMWEDGTKTVVKAHGSEKYSKEHGLAMCVAKKMFGSRSRFLKAVKNGYSAEDES